MPEAVPLEQIPRKGHLPKKIDLNLICYVEATEGKWIGWRTHKMIEIPSVITLEADGQPVGTYFECQRCGWQPYYPRAY